MFKIYKTSFVETIDFAATELKKYLRMMMPACGEIDIIYDPDATDGFRLGLLEHFGLPCEAEDPSQDDVVHIDTTKNGGILAGSNPRSILFAVYRFLKCNGCRFLFPGVDGEYIPQRKPEPVKYHKLADHRYRAHTTEGSPSIEDVLRYIDYHAKQEMNAYAVYSIYPYHRRHYLHWNNDQNRTPEPVDNDLVEQWQALCETELSKRGMLIWGGGHKWVSRTIGLDPKDRYLYKLENKEPAPGICINMAQINGIRGLRKKDPGFTNFCMSRADLRTKLANMVADCAAQNRQYSQIGVYLADNNHNHCECEQCQKYIPSDWYIMIANEIDDLLTQKGLDTKIQLIAYVDCMFPPEKIRLNNPDRFILKATPISRKYTYSLNAADPLPPTKPYVRNAWEVPTNTEEYYAYFKKWQEIAGCPSIVYEYHYWLHQYRDPGMMRMSRRIYEDVMSWKDFGTCGCVQDGSNKSFFPNGFIDYIYGATLLNRDLDYDAELQDYFHHIYGEDWLLAKQYLESISDAFDHAYMCGQKSIDAAKGEMYNPEHAKNLAQVKEITTEFRKVINEHLAMPTRPQTVSWRLLQQHSMWCEGIAEAFILKCHGDNAGALECLNKFLLDFGKHESETERYFDFGLAAESFKKIIKKRPKIEF